jgi:hypothetical protein
MFAEEKYARCEREKTPLDDADVALGGPGFLGWPGPR